MPDRSPSDVIKREILAASAYTLEHFDAEVKLDQNENPHELPEELKQKIVTRFSTLDWRRYPEFVPSRMIDALSRFTGWCGDGILVGNGSNELILSTLVATVGTGRRVAIPQPTFTLYRLLASAMGASVLDVPLQPDMTFDVGALREAAGESDVLIVCSPNNPTGSLMGSGDLQKILGVARGIVIVDEAYYEFSGSTVADLLEQHGNLVILRTFSKAMAMAGLRFGYLLANPSIAREVGKVKLPYNVNIFTLTAAEVLLGEVDRMQATICGLIEERERLRSELDARPGVEVFPSRANFLLFQTEYPAGELFDRLYQAGVLVRNVSHYPMLDRALRVSVGTPEENRKFLAALDGAMEAFRA